MPDINDVVRHVILRILVDQAGLGEEMAAARAKLKSLEQAERDSNKARVRDADTVTKAVERQSEAIEKNRAAHEAADRSAARNARTAADAHRDATRAIDGETRAIKAQTLEEAKAAAIRDKSVQNSLNAEQARRRFIQETAALAQKRDFEQAARETRTFNDEVAHVNALQDKRRTADASALAAIEKVSAATRRLNEQVERSEAESGQRLFNTQRAAEESLDHLKTTNQQKRTAQALLDAAKVAEAQARKESAGFNRDSAASRSQITATRSADVDDAVSTAFASRRAKSVRDEELFRARMVESAARLTNLDQRGLEILERRGRAVEREERARIIRERSGNPVTRSLRGLVETGQDVLRASSEGNPDTRVTRTRNALKALDREMVGGGGVLSGITAFFGAFKKGEGDAVGVLERIRGRFRAVREAAKEPISSGGGGGSFIGRIGSDLNDFASGLSAAAGPLAKFLFSFRGLIVAVVVALGPLAAMLGAVSASALGLASDLANLSGVLFALPGIIGAVVGGFGALALVLKPVTTVFQAFAAAQKESLQAIAEGSTVAKNAALAYKEALLNEQQAQLNINRANQDAPRALNKLTLARRDAARQIQDYRLQLQKLKYDEEGAALGVDTAEQDYRRALADPTMNNLDRRTARHAVEGALFDKRDQKVSEGRLKEDAADAEKKGVEGSDQVVAAQRAVQDANISLATSYIQLQKAVLAAKKAQEESAAGGTAAAVLKAQIAKLPPETRKVVQSILDLNKAYRAMRDRLSEKIFGPLAGDTGKFAAGLKILETFLGPVAEAIGQFADKALKLFTNSDWKAFFSKQGAESKDILTKLGDAALAVAGGFKAITEIARPFTQFVVDGVLGMAKAFERFTDSEDGRKKIGDFLAGTQRTMEALGPIITNFALGLLGFFDALNNSDGANKGKSFTDRINDGLLGISETFRKIGEAASDPNSGFQKWLRDVGPLIKDVVHFLGDAAAFIGDLFSSNANIDEARNLLKSIGDLLKYLADIFDRLSKSGTIDKIVGAIVAMAHAFKEFLDHGGATTLGVFFWILEKIGQTIDTLVTNVPFLTTALAGLSTIIAIIAGAALFGRLTGLFGLLKGITGFVRAIKDGGLSGLLDKAKDVVFRRDSGVSSAQRDARGESRSTGAPVKVDRTNTGGVLPTMYRMEKTLQSILFTLERMSGLGGSSSSGGGPGGGVDDDDPRRKGPKGGPQTGGGGSTGGGSPGERESTRRSGRRAKRTYTVDSLPDEVSRRSRSTSLSSSRPVYDDIVNPRRWGTSSIADYAPIPRSAGGGYEPVERTRLGTRGNDLYRSQRIDNRLYANAVRDEAYEENRRFDADDARNDRPSAGRLSPAQRRREQQRQSYGRRYASVTQPAQMRRFPTPIADILTPAGDTTSYGNLGQYGTAPTPRRARTTGARRRGSGFLDLLFPSSDEGSFGFFGALDGDTETRNRRQGSGRPPNRRGSRATTRRRRSTGRRPTPIASPLGGLDDEYEDGYEDGLNAGGGLSPLDALDTLDDVFDSDNDDDGRHSRRRGEPDDEDHPNRRRGEPADEETRSRRRGRGTRRAGRGGRLSRLFRGGGGGRVSRLLGGAARGAGGLARGLVGGLAGAAISMTAGIGADYLTDKFVKNDEDAASLHRATGAIATGAGIGATIGSVIPGVGTVIGGAVGGLAGGAYSLVKDKNLRNFVGGKISSGAKAVGGFFSGVGSGIADFFGGGDDKPGGKKLGGLGGAAAAALGPVGLLLGKTDIGKSILDSLSKAGKGISDFFTRTIPRFFNAGVRGVTTFFTKTLPSLPGKFFDAFFYGVGRIQRFFLTDLPHAASAAWRGITTFFTTTLPRAASVAWRGITGFIRSIPGFFTQTIPRWFSSVRHWVAEHIRKPLIDFITITIPHFFTVTIPKWFEQVPKWFKKHVIDNVTTFFTKTLPNFFTVTLPNAIRSLPGVIYNNLIQPVLDFFKGIAGHVGDFLKGSWNWAKGLFNRANADIKEGRDGTPTKRMSGGLIEGIYQGVEDRVRLLATPGEFYVRRSKVQQPYGKQFLTDYNEGRFDPAQWYAGLSQAAAPQVMSIVPSAASVAAGAANSNVVSNSTTGGGLHIDGITINNPVRERGSHSMRRALQVAVIRHRL